MIRVAVIHPSFGRPAMAFKAYKTWMTLCDHPEQVEYLIGLDDNDPSIDEYRQTFGAEHLVVGRLELHVGPSRNSVAAMNGLADLFSTTTELILATADDMAPCPHWDTELFAQLVGVDNFKTPRYVGVSDGMNSYGYILNFIVNRAWYTRLGYLVCPEYDGLCSDNDSREVALRLNAVVHAPHLVFPHYHYTTGANAFDDTYARNNNSEAQERNAAIYAARAERNFDL